MSRSPRVLFVLASLSGCVDRGTPCADGLQVVNEGRLDFTATEGPFCRVTEDGASTPSDQSFLATGSRSWRGLRYVDADVLEVEGGRAWNLDWGSSSEGSAIETPTLQLDSRGAGSFLQGARATWVHCADCDLMLDVDDREVEAVLEGASTLELCGGGSSGRLEADRVEIWIDWAPSNGPWIVRAKLAILHIPQDAGGPFVDVEADQVRWRSAIPCGEVDPLDGPATPPPTPLPPPDVGVELFVEPSQRGIRVSLSEQDPDESYSFGFVQTGAQPIPSLWTGEDCLFGAGPWQFCHPIDGDSLELVSVEAPDQVVEGSTTLLQVPDEPATAASLTYILVRDSDDHCWAGGHDPSYAAGRCDPIEAGG